MSHFGGGVRNCEYEAYGSRLDEEGGEKQFNLEKGGTYSWVGKPYSRGRHIQEMWKISNEWQLIKREAEEEAEKTVNELEQKLWQGS